MRATPIKTSPIHLLTAVLLGAASVLAFAPVGWFPLVWLTLGGLFLLLSAARTTRQGAWLGFGFGAGFFGVGVSWVYVSLSVFGGMPPPVAGLATLMFCAVMALFPALIGALFVRLAPAGIGQRALLFAALWVLSEWLRGWVFTGFPWLAIGYAQVPFSPLAGYAPLFGVYGVSLVTALLAALLAGFFAGRAKRRWLLPVSAGLLLLLGQGVLVQRWSDPVGAPLSVALLQGNVPQEMKWRPERVVDSLRTYYRLAEANPAQLTVLPETALPAFLEQVPSEYLEELRQLALRRQGDLLFGVPTSHGREYANSAVSVGASPAQRYSKSHLVPFGEFVPPGFGWFLTLASIPMSDFTRGSPEQAPLQLAGQRVAVNICYEDAFGEEIIRQLPAASLLVNVSNVAWFGDSLAPAQHLQISQTRALETGRMLLRATNTGMTAIVGVDGRVIASLPPFTQGALTGEVQGYEGATPYVRWGNLPAIFLAFLLLLPSLLSRHRRR